MIDPTTPTGFLQALRLIKPRTRYQLMAGYQYQMNDERPVRPLPEVAWGHLGQAVTHVNSALYDPQATRARGEYVRGVILIGLDDVGTKVKKSPPAPTIAIATRPDNQQFLYLLERPIAATLYTRIMRALARSGWTDAGACHVNQWWRVPGSQPAGKPCAAELAWLTADTFTPEQLIELFDLDLEPPQLPALPVMDVRLQAHVQERCVQAVKALAQRQRVLGVNRRGDTFYVRCPWVGEHDRTKFNASEAAIIVPHAGNHWRGGFNCFHEHCKHRGITHVLEWLTHASA